MLPSGALQVNATSEKAPFSVDLVLHSKVVPGESEWFSREQKLELTIAKADRARWTQLLQSDYLGEVKTDWQKFLDHDDELDEIERKSGMRGVEPQGNPGFASAVDDYWRRKRVEKLQSNDFPDLDAVSKLAEKEHKRVGGDFNAIVQRLWADARRDLEQQRARERQEDAWAMGEEVEDEPPSLPPTDLEQPQQRTSHDSGQIKRKFAPPAETPEASSAVAGAGAVPRRAKKRKKRQRAPRVVDEL